LELVSVLKSTAHKIFEISSISNVLGNQKLPKNLVELMDEKRLSERALAYEKLYTLWEKHEILKDIIIKHKSNRKQLEDLYRYLVCYGADQWVKKHYVAVEALTFPGTLDYLLYNYVRMTQYENDRIRVSYRLLDCFKKGKIDFIHPDE
jgi:hypothetical protein